jgi:sodium/hydrogen antiporter
MSVHSILSLPHGAERGFGFLDPYVIELMFLGVILFAAIWVLSTHGERAFTPAAIYLLFGAIAALFLHFLGIDLIDPLENAVLIEHLAEFAVIVALFGAGLRIDRRLSLRGWKSTALLILVVMPLTIAGVGLFASTVMGLSLGAAIVLGAALAPTDPVLARDVKVGPPGKGDVSETHFALTSEAGFNDGAAFPFIFLGVFIAAEGGTSWLTEWFTADVLYAIPGGLLIGAGGGLGIAWFSDWLRRHQRLKPAFDGWLALAAVLVIYGVAETAGTYGFLAAFAGGLAYRRFEFEHESHQRVHRGSDVIEDVTELGMILLLGSTVTFVGLATPGIEGWLLIPVLLLVIRPASVMLAFVRSRITVRERLLIGWFGIRGIGSFYYAAVAITTGVLTTAEAETIYWTIIACAGVSILVHGFTAGAATESITESPDD